mmetsp:Transcript_8643/g.34959  ORF Transcript_8643/g.34959 Transcript_8643/m.34959 type:complete len:205 (+) Transcript_8643:2165-2779(+)
MLLLRLRMLATRPSCSTVILRLSPPTTTRLIVCTSNPLLLRMFSMSWRLSDRRGSSYNLVAKLLFPLPLAWRRLSPTILSQLPQEMGTAASWELLPIVLTRQKIVNDGRRFLPSWTSCSPLEASPALSRKLSWQPTILGIQLWCVLLSCSVDALWRSYPPTPILNVTSVLQSRSIQRSQFLLTSTSTMPLSSTLMHFVMPKVMW